MKKSSQGTLLYSVFYQVYGAVFDVENDKNRIMMQKAVYLLGEYGIDCGSYRFFWDKFGPFSIDLSYDMRMQNTGEKIRFTDRAQKAFKKLKDIIDQINGYTDYEWAEVLASLRYLYTVMYPGSSDEVLLQKLTDLKPYLNRREDNSLALQSVKTLVVE